MKQMWKNLFWIVLVLLVTSVLFSSAISQFKETETLTLSEVATRMSAGEVDSIVVSGDELDITLSDGTEVTAQKERGVGFTETLRNYNVTPEALSAVDISVEREGGWQYWASILVPTLLPLIIIVIVFFWMFRRARTGMNQTFNFGKANLKLSNPTQKNKISFNDVAGLTETKEELKELVDFLKHPQKYLEIGARIPRGVLLVGPPGTGKTLLARAVAGESKVPFFHISASEFVEMFVGVGASRVRDVFATAKKAAPSIIFLDEIDAVGRQRGAGLGGGHDEREQTLNQILVEMDGFERDSNVIVIAASNRPDVLDPALLRPGRFDRRIILDMPDINDREAILKIHSTNKPLAGDVDLQQIGIRTPGFSGADLANLTNEAAILAARQNKKKIHQQDLIDAIEKVMLGPERRSRVISENEKEITAYHEAGHALVAAALKEADPVHKVSIISRGLAGGYTIKLPTEERRLKSRSQFIADLAVALGGYATERAIFKEVTTGSSSDIKRATELAHDVITRFGMSEKLGPRSFGKTEDMVFLGREMVSERDYSEKVAAEIDKEVDLLISNALKTATKIITKHKKLLKDLAQTLQKQETLEKEQFYAIVKKHKLTQIKAAGQ